MTYKKNILIIDDEPDLCLLLKEYFLRKDCNVHFSHTLLEGEKAIIEFHPDVIFLDNNLPDGYGWKKANHFASSYPDVFIVLISAFHPEIPVMPGNARFSMLEKPISMKDLDNQFVMFNDN